MLLYNITIWILFYAGIRAALNTTLAAKVDQAEAPVQKKSLKDIKREKILKARLEYEKKKLLAAQENNFNGKCLHCWVW